MTMAGKRSGGSISSIRDSSERLHNIETASMPLSPSKQRVLFSSPQHRTSKKRRTLIRPELQLAVAQASLDDRETYQECAEILEKVLTAVEDGRTAVNLDESFDQGAQKVHDSQLLPGGRKKGLPRYLQSNYMSKRTQQRLEKEAADKAASERPMDKELAKQRQI